jgi:hypothetical protein
VRFWYCCPNVKLLNDFIFIITFCSLERWSFDPDPDLKLPEELDPDPEKIFADPTHFPDRKYRIQIN